MCGSIPEPSYPTASTTGKRCTGWELHKESSSHLAEESRAVPLQPKGLPKSSTKDQASQTFIDTQAGSRAGRFVTGPRSERRGGQGMQTLLQRLRCRRTKRQPAQAARAVGSLAEGTPSTQLGPQLWAVTPGTVCDLHGEAVQQEPGHRTAYNPQGCPLRGLPHRPAEPHPALVSAGEPNPQESLNTAPDNGSSVEAPSPAPHQCSPSFTHHCPFSGAGTRTLAQSQPAQHWKHQTCPCLATAPPG